MPNSANYPLWYFQATIGLNLLRAQIGLSGHFRRFPINQTFPVNPLFAHLHVFVVFVPSGGFASNGVYVLNARNTSFVVFCPGSESYGPDVRFALFSCQDPCAPRCLPGAVLPKTLRQGRGCQIPLSVRCEGAERPTSNPSLWA